MSSSEQESELSNDEVSEDESDQSEQDGVEESESEEEEPIVAKVVEKKRKDTSRKKKKPAKDPNKPKRNMSAYFLYSNANRARIQRENPDAKFGDIAKLISEEFKTISDKERKKWEKKAAKDKERYLDEMSRYEPPDSETDSDDSDAGKKKKKKRKQVKDPNKPKRNMSAYFLFSCGNRADIKRENPDASFGDIAKLVSQKFKSLSEKERKKWDKKAAKDKLRYEEEMRHYTYPE